MPAVVHESLQRHKGCINQPCHMGPPGRALPCSLIPQRCHHSLQQKSRCLMALHQQPEEDKKDSTPHHLLQNLGIHSMQEHQVRLL